MVGTHEPSSPVARLAAIRASAYGGERSKQLHPFSDSQQVRAHQRDSTLPLSAGVEGAECPQSACGTAARRSHLCGVGPPGLVTEPSQVS
eukprot:7389325-Prymnesium_polylepis.1